MIRSDLEKIEHLVLRPQAAFADRSLGRAVPETPCPIRTDFQRDRDRILHTKSFRRLKHKTQVYIAPLGDHYRTRLTHTLEVAQIGRTIARALRLNEDLVEAIALGHDIGHTPFGHAGEEILNRLSPTGFRHYEHSLRVVDFLESRHGHRGLNLTEEVRDGILHHTGEQIARTLEGYIVKLADRIAYINHDIDDAIRAGSLRESDLPEECIRILGRTCGQRISTLIIDIVEYSKDRDDVRQSPQIAEVMLRLRRFMFDSVYRDDRAMAQQERIERLLSSLYQYYRQRPEAMGEHLRIYGPEHDVDRMVTDYIAGMTDQFAIEMFQQLFLPTAIRRV